MGWRAVVGVVAVVGLGMWGAVGLRGQAAGQGTTGAAGSAMPAVMHVMVRDEGGTALAAVRVEVSKPGAAVGEAGIGGVTDGRGEVTLTVPVLGMGGYMVQMEVQKSGEAAYRFNEEVFDGARIELPCEFLRMRKTVVHVRGAGGEKIEGVTLAFKEVGVISRPIGEVMMLARENSGTSDSGVGEAVRTGADGDFVWEHVPLVGEAGREEPRFELTVGGAGEELARVSSKDVDTLTVTLGKEATEKVFPTRVLAGTVVMEDGKAATGWYVAEQVMRHSNGGLIIGGGMQPMDYYTAERIEHVAGDGGFEVRGPGEILGLISPEGVAFLYGLNPAGWQGDARGRHRVTLTVPGVTRRVELRMVDEAGKGVAGVALRPTWMLSGRFWWQLEREVGWREGGQGDPEWGAVSDEKGVLVWPEYFGATVENFQVGKSYGAGNAETQLRGPLGMEERIVVASRGAAKVAERARKTAGGGAEAARHLTLALVNAEGKVVTDFREMHVMAGGADYGRTPYSDAAGLHYFLPRGVGQVTVDIAEGEYAAAHGEFVLGEGDRQTVTMRIERGKAVRGRVVDAMGKPAPGMAVGIYKLGVPENQGTGGMNVLGMRRVTDGAGRFEYLGAPEECFLAVEGTSERVAVAREQRTVEVKLPPRGSVRVLLPAGFRLPARFGYAEIVSDDPKVSGRLELHWDRVTNTLYRDEIGPGRYHVEAETIPGLGDVSGVHVEVVAGKEAVIDLRGAAVEAALLAKRERVTVAVERQGKGAAGVEVAILSGVMPEERMRRYIDMTLHGADAAARATGKEWLRGAGEVAVGLLPTEGADGAAVQALRGELEKGQDGLEVAAADLTDEAGRVAFVGRVGQRCWAVARVRGKWVGMKEFVVGEGAGPAVVVMEGLRGVEAAVPAVNSTPPMTYSFTLVKPEGMARRVLWRALTDDVLWGTGMGGGSGGTTLVFAVHAEGFTFDGLPVGTVISLQPPGVPGMRGEPAAAEVRIEAGAGAQRVKDGG